MDKKHLLLLLTRPQEPTSALKDVDGAYFNIPLEYLTDRHQSVRKQKPTNENKGINVKKIALPDLTIPMSLGRNEQFSLWIPKHKKIAGRLIDIFMGKKHNS
jgi:tyrosinase